MQEKCGVEGEMAGTGEEDGFDMTREKDCSFEWDDDSKLYFHASSGFYHDPNAGWYYSSRDGLYYSFKNGNYVILNCNKSEESEASLCTDSPFDEPIHDKMYTCCNAEYVTCDPMPNQCPPSEWLEETLIDLYLSGYSNSEVNTDNSATVLQANGEERGPDEVASGNLFDCHHDITFGEIREGESIPKDAHDAPETSAGVSAEDASWDEENWKAQYGQVVQSGDDCGLSFPVVDLWDWEMVTQTEKKRHQVARLTGRLVRRSTKLHPSMPAGGNLLKTATICEVHLDLVRVASGKVYKLRSPSTRYLASLSEYDSSNPTKDWGFPDLFSNIPSANENCGSDTSNSDILCKQSYTTPRQLSTSSDKHRTLAYRDRAAERRTLHGGFGIGPGQKSFMGCNFTEAGSPSQSAEAEVSATTYTAFGSGSCGRRILESMGWKEGEAIGSSTKGPLEPLQAVGNKGCAGLGWKQVRNI